MREFDFEKELQACKDKKREDEIIVFTFGIGRIIPLRTDRKKTRKAMVEAIKYIKKLDGFVSVHPVDLFHNLLLFDSENNAKCARNLLRAQGVECSKSYIVPLLIDTKYLK